MTVEAAMRRAILGATHSATVSGFVRSHGMRLGAARFVAGEDLDMCASVLRALNGRGLHTNTTLLGEGVRDEASARDVVARYRVVLDRIAHDGLRTNIALKLTHLGLLIDEDLAFSNLAELLDHARQLGNFIRIDMEESARVSATLTVYRRLRDRGYENVGAVLQAYLYRTKQDLTDLLPLSPNLRLVKGAYLEPPDVAFPKKADVDANYLALADVMLRESGHTCIATHDERIIAWVKGRAQDQAIPHDRFEFQMLYGVRPQLQLDLVREGYKVLVATPFGPEWYFYLMRRLAERPANLGFVVRNWFKG